MKKRGWGRGAASGVLQKKASGGMAEGDLIPRKNQPKKEKNEGQLGPQLMVVEGGDQGEEGNSTRS